LDSKNLTLLLTRDGKSDNFKSKFKSSLKLNKEIASKRSLINVEDRNSKCMNVFELNESLKNSEINEVKEPSIVKNCVKVNLTQIEKLHKNYFNKHVQDNIVIIANIVNIISTSNKYYQNRMDESLRKRSEAEKLRKKLNAIRLHEKHKKILEIKLKNSFFYVISTFDQLDFDLAFKMFFLSILAVFQGLDQAKFREGSIFENLVILLDNNLKNSEYKHHISSLFQSNKFRPDCINLKCLIEDSWDTDHEVTDRMPLYFVKKPKNLNYFQGVIDAVTTSDSNEDLALLVDIAIFHCYISSELKDSVDVLTVQHSKDR